MNLSVTISPVQLRTDRLAFLAEAGLTPAEIRAFDRAVHAPELRADLTEVLRQIEEAQA
jgi:hypothetical protein